jgi:type IV pilus assembly protein PilV
MAHNASTNENGYTLIEVLIAMMILAIVSVGLMQSQLLVMQKNVENALREDAVRLAEQKVSELCSGPGGFDGPNPDGSNIDLVVTAGAVDLPDVVRTIRNTTVTFHVQKNVAWLDDGHTNKLLTVTVSWMFRNRSYSHTVPTTVRA